MEIQSRTFNCTEYEECKTIYKNVDEFLRKEGKFLGDFPITHTRAFSPDQQITASFYELKTMKDAPFIVALREYLGSGEDRKELRTIYISIPEYCDQVILNSLYEILGAGSKVRVFKSERELFLDNLREAIDGTE